MCVSVRKDMSTNKRPQGYRLFFSDSYRLFTIFHSVTLFHSSKAGLNKPLRGRKDCSGLYHRAVVCTLKLVINYYYYYYNKVL